MAGTPRRTWRTRVFTTLGATALTTGLIAVGPTIGAAVNVTLGLPIIRTSVDHGTALDLAGSGKIDTGSLHVALETAYQMAETRI